MGENDIMLENNEKSFDLNIEKILENWSVHHAIREIISNAIDEQILSNSKNIDIYKKDNVWHIVDYGRGLSYIHLTQNENDEKKNNNRLIGRFGVGLKDALATLYRHGVKVCISSKHGVITLDESAKEGFEDIITLHAKINPPKDKEMIGTDFSFWGCDDKDVDKAKQLFLMFTNDNILETNNYGQIIEKNGETSYIYINGVKAAEEPNFLFSYNITSLNKQIIKAMNRERANIGRSAYTERIKNIILNCNCDKVINSLINDLQEYSSGERHDELNWTEIQLYASKKLSETVQHIAFVTPEEIKESPTVVDDMSRNGYSPVIVSKKLLDKIEDLNENANDDEILTTTSQYLSKQRDEFQPIYVDIGELTDEEMSIYNQTDSILDLIGGCPSNVWSIKITKQIYGDEIYTETLGAWLASKHLILIKRKQLSSLEEYAGTLLHECAHALSCADDVSREFEIELTSMLGKITNSIFKINKSFNYDEKKEEDEDFSNNFINKIADEIEENSEPTLIIYNSFKIDREVYDSILQDYIFNDMELNSLKVEVNDRSIFILEKFDEESPYFECINNDVKSIIIEHSKLYFDDIISVMDKYDIDDIEQEQIYSYLLKNYDVSYDNIYLDKLKSETIVFKKQLKLITKEKYSEIMDDCISKYYEDIEDYIEKNNICIVSKDFVSLLDLITITVNVFDQKISQDMISEFIFEYNLDYKEMLFLNNWLIVNEIDILEDPEFPFNRLFTTNNTFLVDVYLKLYECIPSFDDDFMFGLFFKYYRGDEKILEKIEIYSLKILIKKVIDYSNKNNFLFLLKEGVRILENSINKYDLKTFNNVVSFISLLTKDIEEEFEKFLTD